MVAQAARNSPRGEEGVGILYIIDAACYCSSRYKAMRDSVKNILDHMCAQSVVLLIPPAKPSVAETGEEVFSEFMANVCPPKERKWITKTWPITSVAGQAGTGELTMAFLIRLAEVRTGSGNKRTRMNAVTSLWEQTQLWQTNYMADVPRPSQLVKIPRNFGDELEEEEVQEECGVADNSTAMIDSASSTCEKQGTPNLFERLPRNKVGPYIRESQRGTSFKLSQLVWDRLVVVDTSAAAGDVVLAAFSRMSLSQSLGGGQIIDPQDAKLYYVGCELSVATRASTPL